MNVEPRIVTFSWTENDWMRAQREAFYYGRGTYWFGKNIAIWIATTVFLQLIWHGMSGHMPTVQNFFEIELGFIVFLVPLIGSAMIGLRAKAVTTGNRIQRLAPEQYVDVSWEIGDDGVTYRQREDRLYIPWKLIRRADLTKDYLLIVNERMSVHILPRHIFPDKGKAWYEAINAHVKTKNADAKAS